MRRAHHIFWSDGSKAFFFPERESNTSVTFFGFDNLLYDVCTGSFECAHVFLLFLGGAV